MNDQRSTISLTGWGHPPDALRDVAPKALHVEYTHVPSVDAALGLLAQHVTPEHSVLGWSMGARLAALAIAKKLIAPRKIIMLAAPYQFVATPEKSLGMKHDLYTKFAENLKHHPERTFKKAYGLIQHGDTVDISAPLAASLARLPAHDWEYWFSSLMHVDFDAYDLSHFPETHIVHGAQDVVVDVIHAHTFAKRIPHAKVHIFEHCGHAPHWHNPQAVGALL